MNEVRCGMGLLNNSVDVCLKFQATVNSYPKIFTTIDYCNRIAI